MSARGSLLPAALLLLGLILYLPTLRIGFLTDDFLDIQTDLSNAAQAFTGMSSSGYRPLMSYSWALDNAVWGVGRPWGWHLTNLMILALTLLSLAFFLRLFVTDGTALAAGLALFAFSSPVLVSVAKMDWRTSILPVIPLLWSLYYCVRYSRGGGRTHLASSVLLLLISVFLKEIALAIPPAFALLAWSESQEGQRRRKTVQVLAASGLAVVLYLAARYMAVGLSTGYSESSAFGFFMARNILTHLGTVLSPWTEGLPARVLLPLLLLFLWLLPATTERKVFIAAFSFFSLFTVSNLPPRTDYAVAAVPAFSLAAALLIQEKGRMKGILPAVLLVIGAMFLNSLDQRKTIQDASSTVEEATGRIAAISDSLPGTGPVFIHWDAPERGGYGTFWPGEFMMPLRASGYDTERLVAGADRIWDLLLEHEGNGHLVFLMEEGFRDYPVSLLMYEELPDTTVFIQGCSTAGELIRYPSCTGTSPVASLCLYCPSLCDTLLRMEPKDIDGQFFFDLASQPVWLSADEGLVMLYEGELTFTSLNVSLDEAIRRVEMKRLHL